MAEGTQDGQEISTSQNGRRDIAGVEDREAAEAERLEAELALERERHLRTLADFDNYRRRARLERAGAERAGKRDLLLGLLDVLDDFDRAVLHVGDAAGPVADGLRLIHQRLRRLLESDGVTPFGGRGEQFDPEIHEAMSVVESDGAEPGVVHEVDRRGYLWDGELLRPARVIVVR